MKCTTYFQRAIQRNRFFFLVVGILALTSFTTHTFLSAPSYTLSKQTCNKVSQRIDDLYFSGWPVENIRNDFNTTKPLNSAQCASIHQDLMYRIDRDLADIQEKKIQAKKSASVLYIDAIAQPTTRLETLFSLLDEGIATENYDMINSSIFLLYAEIETLREQQKEDIALMVVTLLDTIESLETLGIMYGLSFQNERVLAREIVSEGSYGLETYHALQPIKQKLSDEFDRIVTRRGGTPTNGKRILISIGRQRLYMIEDYAIIYEMPASTGIHGHGTAAGEFQVYDKVDMAWGYYRIWMPYWLTIYYSGGLENGIHGIPISPINGRWSNWDYAVGNYPITYGCVMPHDWDAKRLYEWAEIGTPVSIVYR